MLVLNRTIPSYLKEGNKNYKKKKLTNHHIINSLKRPNSLSKEFFIEKRSIKANMFNLYNNSKVIHLRNKYFIYKNNNLHSILIILIIMLFGILININETNCDAIVCPKDLSPIYPCSCQNGTQALLIKCTRLNLATLSNSMKNLQDNYSIEQLEIEHSSISRLFGPLFNDSSQYKFHSTIRELDIRASGLKIIDINSFSQELLKNLQYLMFDRNSLQQVPIELINNMTNLRLLNLSTNLITSIDNNAFIKLTNLTDLDLSNNKITKLNGINGAGKNIGSFNSLFNLEYLNLNNNDLTKLDKNLFLFGRKLRFLDISNNKLTNLDRQDFNELTSLETLKISNNLLTTIPRSIFSRNAKLYNLDLSNNKLEDIDTYLFKSTRFLKDLNISGNLIKEITKNTFSPTTRIKRLNISANSLSALGPETFKGLEWLELIDLSHNQIVNISNDAFNRIYSVEIDLSFNKLTRIFYWAFHEVSNITKLDLSHNFINEGISLIAFEQTDCAILDLSYNQIQDISKIPISNLTSIRILDLSHNQITEFNKKSFTQKFPLYELHTIDASFNNISSISGNILEKLKSIRTFNISYNSLRRLTSGGLGNSPTLLELDLSHNNLVEVVSGTLVGLVSMKNLDISFNRLKKMIPIPVALNSIHLEYNEIGQLSRTAFPSLNSLLELYLDHNRINTIEEGTFSTLLALHTLSLSFNNLTTIPAAALKDLASLQNLSLEGNIIQRLNRKAFGILPIVFHLRLDQNNISSIADRAFDGLLQLLTLNISHNNLLEIPPEAFFGLVSLRTLDLSNNQLNRFENKSRSAMEDLLSLEVANFSNNKLSMITGKTFLSSQYIPYKLTHLDLSNNLIGIIANNFANGFKRLEWLSLRQNIINEIYPNVLGNASYLKHLDLSHNKLRQLKEGTFPSQLINLTSLSLANNKLTTIQIKELDRLRNLLELDLSSNRLETFFLDSIRWIKSRGMLLDLRNNNLECTCELLPFIAWIDGIKYRHNGQTNSRQNNNLINSNNSRQQQYNTKSNIVNKYLQSAQLISNLTCAKPEVLMGKSIMNLIDQASSIEMNCDKIYLDEADSFRSLKAPIQFNGAEPYYYDGEQYLKIGWTLIDQQLDSNNYYLLKTKFQQPFDLSLYHLASTSPTVSLNNMMKNNAQQQNSNLILEQTVERVSYDQRTHLLRNLDSNAFYVICITYETTISENSPSQMIDQLIIKSHQATSNNSTSIEAFASIVADFNRINCVDMNSLLKNDFSDKLVSASSSSNYYLNYHQSNLIILLPLNLMVIMLLFRLFKQVI